MFNISQYRMNICGIMMIFLICVNFTASAASPSDAGKPDAGKIANSVEEKRLIPPEKTTRNIEIGSQKPETVVVTNEQKIKVERIHITGQNIYSEKTLALLCKDKLGQELTFTEVEELARRVTKYFHDRGYIVANAFIPTQDIKEGVVEIAVVVGKYGKIDIYNHSQLSTKRISSLLKGIKPGKYIRQDKLERTLLLLNDTSGVRVKGTLVKGKESGTSDLIIDASDTTRLTGQLSVDNYGNHFTGQTRKNLNVVIHNPSGIGDEAILGGTYTGSGMNNGNLSYQFPVGSQGAQVGASYSRTHYLLGGTYASLNANGVAKMTSFFATYPLVRSYDYNLYGRIGFDGKRLEDRQDSVAVPSVSKKRANLWSLGINGDKRDSKGDGSTSFALSYYTGHLGIDSQDAYITDQSTSHTSGSYNKTTLSLSRVKMLNQRLSYYLFFTGQLASKNLDSSEKLSLGGANGIRAYPQGEASGDAGYILTGELRWNMPTPKFQLAVFVDNGRVTLNKNPWDASINKRILTGAGIGLIWNKPNDYSVRLDYARKVTSDPANSDTDKRGRFWLQCIKRF